MNAGERAYIDRYGNGYFVGNLGIGTNTPTAQLHTTGTVRFTGTGTPGSGKVLTSDASGNATWQTPVSNLPSGTSGQMLRFGDTNWVANSVILNNGTSVAIGTNPIAKVQFLVSRGSVYVPGYANVYGVRMGSNVPSNGGTSWSEFESDVAVKGYTYFGNNYTAAVAGYSYLDYANSASVIGSNEDGSLFGALGYKDASSVLWAGYFQGKVSISDTVKAKDFKYQTPKRALCKFWCCKFRPDVSGNAINLYI